jgi:hypothetical protein
MTVLSILVLTHVFVLVVPDAPWLPPYASAQGYLATLWQVSAGLVSVAIVFVILVLETVQRAVQGPFVWRRFARTSRFFAIVTFLLGTVLSGGVSSLLLLPASDESVIPFAGLRNLLLVDGLGFVLSVAAVLWLYANVFRFLRPDFVQELFSESLSSSQSHLR